jgi:hypothetical protein
MITPATLEALDSTGKTNICLKVSSDIYPDEVLHSCTETTPTLPIDVGGQVNIAESVLAWSVLRDLCKALIKARSNTL